MDILHHGGASVASLPFWYDVDRPEDLKLLKTHLPSLEALGIPVPSETLGRFDQG